MSMNIRLCVSYQPENTGIESILEDESYNSIENYSSNKWPSTVVVSVVPCIYI